MLYCDELLFGIIPPNRFFNIKTINIIFSYDEEDCYDNIDDDDDDDDDDYVNYYDGVKDYYLDDYGYVEDGEIINCKKIYRTMDVI